MVQPLHHIPSPLVPGLLLCGLRRLTIAQGAGVRWRCSRARHRLARMALSMASASTRVRPAARRQRRLWRFMRFMRFMELYGPRAPCARAPEGWPPWPSTQWHGCSRRVCPRARHTRPRRPRPSLVWLRPARRMHSVVLNGLRACARALAAWLLRSSARYQGCSRRVCHHPQCTRPRHPSPSLVQLWRACRSPSCYCLCAPAAMAPHGSRAAHGAACGV